MIRKNVTLLTTNNHKTVKGEKLKYKTLILYMAPHKQNSKGINLCPHASEGCSKACLFKSGFGGMYSAVEQGRINKTEWFLADKKGFMLQLVKEIQSAIKKYSNDWIVTVRLNGTSDIRWEKIIIENGKNIFQMFNNVQFYDYTKNPLRFDVELPKNYHLTFSRSETNHETAMDLLARGFNVAWVFHGNLPETYLGYKVINGDETDLRALDPKNVIVGLKYKNNTGKGGEIANKIAIESGFVTVV